MGLSSFLTDDGKEELTGIEQDRIVDEVKRLGCSYPTELGNNLMINSEKVAALVHFLVLAGRLKRLLLNPLFVPEPLMRRLSYFWSMGIHGFPDFNRRRWVVIADKIDMTPLEDEPMEVQEELITDNTNKEVEHHGT